MKKLLPILLTGLIITSVAYAEGDSADLSGDWSDIGNMQNSWDGQEMITDDLFEKVIQQNTKQAKEKQEKKFKKKMGESIIPIDSNVSSLKEIVEDYPTLLVPKTLISDSTIIPPGFYRILAAKNKKGYYTLNFYQGNNLVGKLPAKETHNDFDAETINFAKIIYTDNENRAQVVYGCLEYNLIAHTDTK